jgi:hypothetical protein
LFEMQVTATGSTMTVAFVNQDPSNDNSNGLDAVSLLPAQVTQASAAPAAAPTAAAAPSSGAATQATAAPSPATASSAAPPSGQTQLSAADTSAAFQAAGFKNSGGQWRSDCDDPGTPSYSPGSIERVADLNGDGQPEVVIVEGGTYCYGMTGQGYWLVSQRRDGRWQLMDRGTGLVEVLATKGSDGWPDLSIGGPGFCFPVLRWNGRDYQQQRWEYDGKACKPPN